MLLRKYLRLILLCVIGGLLLIPGTDGSWNQVLDVEGLVRLPDNYIFDEVVSQDGHKALDFARDGFVHDYTDEYEPHSLDE
ncbi:MAG: hypothetical protein ACOX2X_02280 [Peptococcia bacterium]